jgi:hypothetical protein
MRLLGTWKGVRLMNRQKLIDLGVARHLAKDNSFRNKGGISKIKTWRKNNTYEKFVNFYAKEFTVAMKSECDESWLYQFVPHVLGIMGEFAYADYTNDSVDEAIYDVRDDGFDFKGRIEVKTSTFVKSPDLKISQKEFNKRGLQNLYVLCLIDPNEPDVITVLGSITGVAFKACKKEKQYGGGPLNWVVGVEDLSPINYSIKIS